MGGLVPPLFPGQGAPAYGCGGRLALSACPKRMGDLSPIGQKVRIATVDNMAKAVGRSFDTRLKTNRRPSNRLPGVHPTRGGRMRRSTLPRARSRRGVQFGLVALVALAAVLLVPASALADATDLKKSIAGKLDLSVGVNTTWVIAAGSLVMFMQAGFAFLEIGFSRAKNAGTVVAKILTNFSIAAVAWWAIGFMFAFSGPAGGVIGHEGGAFFTHLGPYVAVAGGVAHYHPNFPVMDLSNATIESKWFFQFVFCAVSLAIVWGTTLERIKFGVYIIYSLVFASLIYPIGAHWVFGGGFLQQGHWLGTSIAGMQDFAGSTAVHLIGASGAFAALLLLGARTGKYGPDGKPRAIPGHNMPLFGLGVLILWLGWFGFNPGSTLNAMDGRFTEVALVTMMAAAAGVVIGALAGWSVPLGVYAVDKKIGDPVGALTAHCMCGVWGTLACGLFTSPRLAKFNAVGDPGLVYTGSFHQLFVQLLGVVTVFAFVFVLSYGSFWLIKRTYGMRVTAEEEEAGLDIVEHGMYGYPEQFIPAPELIGYTAPSIPTKAPAPVSAATTREVPA